MCIIFSLVSLVVKEVSCNVEPSYFINNLCRIHEGRKPEWSNQQNIDFEIIDVYIFFIEKQIKISLIC